MSECVDTFYDYNPRDSKYEFMKDNMKLLVIHGSGYVGVEEPPEEEWVESFDGYSIETKEANDYVINNFKMQRTIYFKEIELAEEWDLDKNFLDELWETRKGEWITYSDPSGVIYFKVLSDN